jgi:DNA-binding HxlR family transcriptional regulator
MIPGIKEDTAMVKRDLTGLCPYVTSQKVLSGKWSIYLLYLLQEGPVRFNELQRKMPEDITHTTLSRQLKTLEGEGLIVRREFSQIPPRVEYSLSEIGMKFETVLEALGDWGSDYIEFVKNKNTKIKKDGEAI